MRIVRLALGEHAATTRTTLVVDGARDQVSLRLDGDVTDVRATGVDAHQVAGGEVRLDGVRAGARIQVTGQVAYRSAPHGLARLDDPVDGSSYVVGSGALGGAAHFLACEEGPADRYPTTIEVAGGGPTTVATGTPVSRDCFVSALSLPSHQLGLASGPWRMYAEGSVSLLARRSLRPERVGALLSDAARALAWVSAWFGTAPPGGATYTQVLLPEPPWLAMEHPGCVLVSERLLDAREPVARGRRIAVLAHEAAHQWIGNLVCPRRWEDVGAFEGLAELIGQLACEALLGPAAAAYLEGRRAAGPVIALRSAPDARTAGLAEVAGPAQHAELFRSARDDLGAAVFADRVRRLCRERSDAAGTATGSEVWAALGLDERLPPRVRLPPTLRQDVPATDGWQGLGGLDPATAVARARASFRGLTPGPDRVRSVVRALRDERLSAAVAVGLGAEIAPGLAAAEERREQEESGSVVAED